MRNVVVAVALLAGCIADSPRDVEPPPEGTCHDFRERTVVAQVTTTTPDFSHYRCKVVALDPDLVLPLFMRRTAPDVVTPLLEYRRAGLTNMTPELAPDFLGIYGYRSADPQALPERHPDEPCEWITIPREHCIVEQN